MNVRPEKVGRLRYKAKNNNKKIYVGYKSIKIGTRTT